MEMFVLNMPPVINPLRLVFELVIAPVKVPPLISAELTLPLIERLLVVPSISPPLILSVPLLVPMAVVPLTVPPLTVRELPLLLMP